MWRDQLRQSLEDWRRKAMLGVWRTGAGKRCSECGGLAPESDARSVEEWRPKAMLGVWRNGTGKRCSEFGGIAPESDAWSSQDWRRKARLGMWPKTVSLIKSVDWYQRYSVPRLRNPQGRQNPSSSTKDILYQDCAVHLTADKVF